MSVSNRQTSRRLFDQPPEVIERWMKLKASKLATDLGRRTARPKIWLQERKRRAALEAAFDAVKTRAIALEKSEFEASKVFVNVALFFLLAERDINAVKLDALTHPDPWTRGVALRTILLTIHEWDMDKVAGQKLRRAMAIAGIPGALQDEVTGSLRDLRKSAVYFASNAHRWSLPSERSFS